MGVTSTSSLAQIEQWEEYYKAEGHAEEDIQRWLQDWINRGPDPPADVQPLQSSSSQIDAPVEVPEPLGDPVDAQSPLPGAADGLEATLNAATPDMSLDGTLPEMTSNQVNIFTATTRIDGRLKLAHFSRQIGCKG